MDKLDFDIIEQYELTKSLSATGKNCGVSYGKARKILISHGVIPDNTRTHEIMRLYVKDFTVPEIAAQLGISESAVSAHLPYAKGPYGGENPSNVAIRIRKCRQQKSATG